MTMPGYEQGYDPRGFNNLRTDGKCPAEFFFKSKYMGDKQSAEVGYPLYKDVAYIRFYISGGTIHERAVRDEDKFNYPKSWSSFSSTGEQRFDGTPLEEWPMISPAQLATLKHSGFRTVQQFVDAPDTAIQQAGMGMLALRAKARTWIESYKSQAPLDALTVENQNLKTEVDVLKAQMSELIQRFQKSESIGNPVQGTWPTDQRDAAAAFPESME